MLDSYGHCNYDNNYGNHDLANQVTDYELIPGGRNIRVTEENKHKYVDLIAEHRLTTAIRPQINAFLEGFNELISRDLISIFHDKELELLISGLPDIDREFLLYFLIISPILILFFFLKMYLCVYFLFSGRLEGEYRVFWVQCCISYHPVVLGGCSRLQQRR